MLSMTLHCILLGRLSCLSHVRGRHGRFIFSNFRSYMREAEPKTNNGINTKHDPPDHSTDNNPPPPPARPLFSGVSKHSMHVSIFFSSDFRSPSPSPSPFWAGSTALRRMLKQFALFAAIAAVAHVAGAEEACVDLVEAFAKANPGFDVVESGIDTDIGQYWNVGCDTGYTGWNVNTVQSLLAVACRGNPPVVAPLATADDTWECLQFECDTAALDAVAGADVSNCVGPALTDAGACNVGCSEFYTNVSGRHTQRHVGAERLPLLTLNYYAVQFLVLFLFGRARKGCTSGWH